MQKHKNYLPSKKECKNYALFLDRDGVINQPIIDDYAKKPDDFKWSENVVSALSELSNLFKYVVLVTNQQGIGRELMSVKDLEDVHLKLYNKLKEENIRYFNCAFYAPYLKQDNPEWRKPNIGMPIKAKEYLKDIDFRKSLFVGDSPSDMELADNLGMLKVRIENSQFKFNNQDFSFKSLAHFMSNIT